MKKLLLNTIILLYFLPAIGQPISKDINTVIGRIYKKINEIEVFKNYKEEEGILIRESLENKNGFSKISDGTNTMILYTKYILSGGNKILSILDVGRVEKNTRIIMARCRVNIKNDGYIVALVKPLPWKSYFKNIIKAWRVDVKTNKFIPISVNGIDCINEEYDNDTD